jgi:hypothetical protein
MGRSLQASTVMSMNDSIDTATKKSRPAHRLAIEDAACKYRTYEHGELRRTDSLRPLRIVLSVQSAISRRHELQNRHIQSYSFNRARFMARN